MTNRTHNGALSIILLACAYGSTVGQNPEDISKFLSTTAQDASKLASAYLEPAVKSMSYGMTANWYTTASTHKKLGVDLSLSINLAFIPSTDDYFDPTKVGLSSSTTYSGNISKPGKGAPTFFGPKDQTTYTASYDPGGGIGTQSVTFDGPEGLAIKQNLGFGCIPVPVAQLGIGTIKSTDLKFRYLPKINANGSQLQMFGVGIQHDIKQHVQGLRLLPIDLSVVIGYNSLKGTTDLKNNDPSDARPDSNDGEGVYKFNSWVFQALVSKKIAVLTLYGGLGYSFINTAAHMNGTYTINGSTQNFNIKDPIAIDFSNKSLRFTAGLRLKFGPIYFNGDYTLQKYNMLSVGFGVSVR